MSKKLESLLFVSILILTLALSLWSPSGDFTTTPKYWWDESFTVENARTFIELHAINMTVAPDTPSENAITVNANGFPLILPLAGVYTIFGIGITQTRIYMICWILILITTLYFFLRKFFDVPSAITGTLFVSTFASFYANGRTATGDIPGFFFLILALLFILHKQSFFVGGLFLGLAIVTKISVYHMIFPAIMITLIISNAKMSIKQLTKITGGFTIIGIVWAFLLLPRPITFFSIQQAFNFFDKPYQKLSLLERIPNSLPEILLSTTFIYFAMLFVITILAFKKGTFSREQKKLYIFTYTYIIFQFYVFMSSPGWNRYLIASELLLLILFLPSLRILLSIYTPSRLMHIVPIILTMATIFIASAQTIQYLYFSDIFSKPNPSYVADNINNLLTSHPDSSIGFINNPMIAALIPGNKKFQLIHVGGDTYIGTNPLDNQKDKLPTYMYNFDEQHRSVIEKYYREIELAEGIRIFEKKN